MTNPDYRWEDRHGPAGEYPHGGPVTPLSGGRGGRDTALEDDDFKFSLTPVFLTNHVELLTRASGPFAAPDRSQRAAGHQADPPGDHVFADLLPARRRRALRLPPSALPRCRAESVALKKARATGWPATHVNGQRRAVCSCAPKAQRVCPRSPGSPKQHQQINGGVRGLISKTAQPRRSGPTRFRPRGDARGSVRHRAPRGAGPRALLLLPTGPE